VTLRGATLTGGTLTQGPATGASGAVHISPTDAPGSVVYWTSSGGTSFQGFSIGDAKPVTVLTPASAGTASTGRQATCISCHTSSRDGKLGIYTRNSSNGTRAIDARRIDGKGGPDAETISPSALALLGRHSQGAPVLSAAHYSATDAVAVASQRPKGRRGQAPPRREQPSLSRVLPGLLSQPALYVTSQIPTENNHTPACDIFEVSNVPK
jgi:hypothetical protein